MAYCVLLVVFFVLYDTVHCILMLVYTSGSGFEMEGYVGPHHSQEVKDTYVGPHHSPEVKDTYVGPQHSPELNGMWDLIIHN